MGASLITDQAYGNSLREAYNNAVEEAVYEYGNDSYNGTISTTSGVVDKTDEYRRMSMSLNDYAEYLYENNKISKWGNAVGICISEPKLNNNKIKSQVTNFPQKGTRSWKTVYTAYTYDDNIIGEADNQAEAIKMARTYTEREKHRSYVKISKKLVDGNSKVAEISYKKANDEKMGRYYFVALAAE